MSTLEKTVQSFKELVKRMKHYNEAIGLIYWDLRTGAPKKGVEQRSQVIGTLSSEVFRMATSDEMKEYLEALGDEVEGGNMDEVTRAMVREAKKEYDLAVKIPPERHQAFVVLTSQAESVWEDARKNSDFSLFQPYLEKIVAFQKEFIGYWGYKDHPYDTLLDQYEPGITVKELDPLFTNLRAKIVPLVQAVTASPVKPKVEIVKQPYPIEQQKAFCHFILEKMGYDFEAGRLDDTAHPFAIGLNPKDVRVTNRYNPNDIREAIFGAIHEGGHALYEQNIDPKLTGTNLSDGTSMGIHESQSRFYENIIGRSLPFWQAYFDDLKRFFPQQLEGVQVEDFHFAVNESIPSLIRTESDELTYNLHIMIRYELEKRLISGELQVAELPGAWNEMMKEYLDVVPEKDSEGVLQDVHWAGGSFGYFPSYSLGNLYAAQLEHQLRIEHPDYEEKIRNGEIHIVGEWLAEKVHRYGKMLRPGEIILKATGEPLNAKYLTDYLDRKYKALYHLG
ncbi:MAG: carboxypeptidase M32 [Thermicanus sp.]|nr:carboxypeptidase M32 [Thermicanus sp.]